jgi:hypothetical protein
MNWILLVDYVEEWRVPVNTVISFIFHKNLEFRDHYQLLKKNSITCSEWLI